MNLCSEVVQENLNNIDKSNISIVILFKTLQFSNNNASLYILQTKYLRKLTFRKQ